ncbi:SGNH/GDSL hydrolase family protein [Bacillus sp. SJS]|uniref:SGNH/GDSL hydrolase family protein n=1 Tax=Bacillus sp. SJS TaxID=1423321 RepID=UPI0004DD535D|nr:SGNH/GDSL hydrolase family protein [Bacillus sp. SJS]KZZ85066.1 hypothetical protein AS29_008440 [Bacillus sp. SJS]
MLKKCIQSANKDCIIIIQPSYPLYDAKYYPKEVEKLKNYTTENGIAYLNHWENWPPGDSEDLLSYLNEDETAPSPRGQKAWADYLTKVFVAK